MLRRDCIIMPHLFTNRRRRYKQLLRLIYTQEGFIWELLNSTSYLIGSILFIIGSILFLPRYQVFNELNIWLFLIGSLILGIVAATDWRESRNNLLKAKYSTWRKVEFISANFYLFGALLFSVGSTLFLPILELKYLGAWSFILGNTLFMLGISINITEITRARSKLLLEISNLNAVTFLLGCFLFLSANIPFLWRSELQNELILYTTYQFIIGSICFFIGGIISIYRGYLSYLHHKKNSI